jgi:hypothetical protein
MRKTALILSLPQELYIEILEWMPLLDAIVFSKIVGLSSQLPFQHHQFLFDKNGSFKWNCQFLYSLVEERSDFFDSLCLNTRFNRVFSIHEKLMIACELGFTSQISILLKNPRVDPAIEDNRAIRIACAGGHVDALRVLINDSRIDPSSMHNFPLLVASLNGFENIVSILLSDPRVSSVSRNNAVVVAAAQQGHAKVVKLLLEDKKIEYCRSTLTEAMKSAHSKGHEEVVLLLADYLQVDPPLDNSY